MATGHDATELAFVVPSMIAKPFIPGLGTKSFAIMKCLVLTW
jgi:hypothetical protein